MSAETSAVTAQAGPLTREARERQYLEAIHSNPLQIYAAYLRVFGTGDADAPTLTPREMVKSLLNHEFPQ
jgi:hypothetical protein